MVDEFIRIPENPGISEWWMNSLESLRIQGLVSGG